MLESPPEVAKDLTVIDVPLPTREELAERLQQFAERLAADERFGVELDSDTPPAGGSQPLIVASVARHARVTLRCRRAPASP